MHAAGAQSLARASARQPSLGCYRGRPLPACRTFVLTEIGYYPLLATTSSPFERFPGDTSRSRVRDFGSHGTIDVGAMRNVGGQSAIGATLVFGLDRNGARYGAKARYRRWLNADGLAVDFGGGLVSGPFREFNRTTILSTDAALNFSDYGALVARVEAARVQRRTPTSFSGGLRLGSKPALIATGLTFVASLVLVAAFSRFMDD